MKQSEYIAASLGRTAKRAAAQMKPLQAKGQVLTPTEQMQRFLAGAERARLESGEITPTEWHEYQVEMLRRLGMEV